MLTLDACTPCYCFQSFLMCLNTLSFSFTWSSVCIICSNLSANSDLFVTSRLAKYPDSIYGCINLLQKHLTTSKASPLPSFLQQESVQTLLLLSLMGLLYQLFSGTDNVCMSIQGYLSASSFPQPKNVIIVKTEMITLHYEFYKKIISISEDE